MQRKVNVRFLGWTVAILLVAGTLVAVIHEIQVRRNAAALATRADEALTRGDLQQAVLYYNQYLSYEPDDTSALVRYGRTLRKLATTPEDQNQAFLILDQAVRRLPSDETLRRGTMELALDLGRYVEALEHLEVLLQHAPRDAGLWQKQGWCREELGEFAKAETCYRNAIDADSSYLVAYADLANLLQSRLGRPRSVRQVLDRMVAANPKSYSAYLTRARYLEASGSHAEAWPDLLKAYALNPDETEVLLTKARMEEKKRDVEAARTTLQKGLDAHPADLQYCEALAYLEVRAKRPTEAVRWLQRGLKQKRQAPELRLALADLLVDNGSPAEAEAAIAQLRQEYAAPAVADCLQARLWMQQGQWSRAIAVLEKCRPGLVGEPGWRAYADCLLGRAHARSGDVEQALACFERARQGAPNLTAARFGLGTTLLEAGRVEDAITELQHIRDANDAPADTTRLLAQALLLKNRVLPRDQQDWEEVGKAIQEATAHNPNSVAVLLLQADLLAEQKQFAAARVLLTQARAKHPEAATELTIARADLMRMAGERETARAMLEDMQQKQGNGLPIRLAWLRFWLTERTPEARQGLAGLELNLQALAPGDQVRLLRELAQISEQQGDTRRATRQWQAIAQRQPHDWQSRFRLFDLALHQQDEASARKALEELRRVEGDTGALWRYGQAALIATFAPQHDAVQRDRARRLLVEVKKRRPTWGRVALLEGWLDEQDGREDQAIAHYLRGVQQGEVQSQLAARLVHLLFERRRFAEADLVLRQAEERGLLTWDLTRMAVEIALLLQEPERAVALSQQAVPDTARDYRDLLWRAQVLRRAGMDSQAEQVLLRLTETASSLPDVWVALVEQLVRTGQADRVAPVLTRAETALPADRRLWTLGRCQEILGDMARAEEIYQKDIESQPYAFLGWRNLAEFYLRHQQFARSEKWLRKLIHPANQLPAEIVLRSRRQLALALAQQGDAAKFQEALTLLKADRQNLTATRENEITRALVLATQARHQAEACDLLEKARRQHPLRADEEYALANLYMARRDSNRAFAIFQKLVLVEGEKPAYLVPYIRGLIQRRDLNAAQDYLDRLVRHDRQNPDLAVLRGLLERARREQTSPLP
jgi:tetratricopeptide (TPR) repeat protein